MPGSIGHPDGGGGAGGGGPGAPAGGDPSPGPPPPPLASEGAEEAAPAPRPPPEPDDAAAALRLALDQLSVLGLSSRDHEGAAGGADGGTAAEPAPPDGPEVAVAPPPLPEPEASPPPRPSPPDVFAGFAPHPAALGPPTLLAEQMSVIGSRKKSVNMTECVPVPSSEHVAEIVGRQGCKIKALRAKTNTYIKTPVRGEEPVFIVTGRKEDVEMAKREILSAAEHFSVIRATRTKAGGLPGAAQGPPNLPGQTTIQVRVPYRVVGLVVGPKGATIKRIQQRTHTYIVTPGRDKEPVFAVTGMPENVDRAREEIEAHITLRTGAFTDAGPDSDFHANGTDVCLDLLGAAAGLWAKAPNPGRRPPVPTASLRGDSALGAPGGPEAFYPGSRGAPPVPDTNPTSPYGGSGNGGFTFGGDGPGAPTGPPAPEDCDFGFDFLALDLTVPAAATIWAPFERAAPLPAFSGCAAANGAPAPPAPGVRRSSGAGTPRHSPTLPEPSSLGLELPLARRPAPDPVGALPWRPPQGSLSSFSTSASFSTATSLPSSSPAASCTPLDSSASESSRKPSAAAASGSATSVVPAAAALPRECVVCAEGEVMAALVPCGHNLFCMDCAVRICGKSQPECPACHTPATQAIHIFS
ncbi:RNA-binding protein MEX3D [Rousettus aegyptiacus]|uniref:Mex-3 RNA binding family member D n=1 Tax=Rousettus aegyptiacus TaxID=9407 RepID=A0A7J8BTG0_ROUAE|nr:RNA-binding protein MEX3D [Rousettus aegyptiacus]KAF6401756.1 mex-3 RNA binding family member D [Rousettus aegyptiacus]